MIRRLTISPALACALVLAAMAGLLAACGGNDGGIGGTGNDREGTMRVALTDAPSCGYDAVNVTVEKVRVHRDLTAAESASGWHEVTLTPPRRIDLLTLTNGLTEPLGQTQLPEGTYTQLRLVLAANSASAPLANAVTPTGGSETALSTPSAQQSGLKVPVNITVPAGQVADVVIDFDACKSVVRAGNSGRYNLKPVLRVVSTVLSNAGDRIRGHVDAALAGRARVSAQQGGVEIAAAVPVFDAAASASRYELYPLASGAYTLVVTAEGRRTAVVTGVPVAASAPTVVGSVAEPLAPPVAASGVAVVTGTLQSGGATTDLGGTVNASQVLQGPVNVQVALAVADADTGEFTLRLPRNGPVRAAYAVPLANAAFLPDAAAGISYTVGAQLGANAALPQTVDAAIEPPLPLVFLFP